MTLKEMATRSGLSRSSIQFYQSQGLLQPESRKDYSEQDLAALLRVHLLRSLGISLEEIKALHVGAYQLPDVLKRLLEKLGEDQAPSKAICQELLEAGVDYTTLNGALYLRRLEQAAPPAAIREEPGARVQAPWRRFFARNLDLALCTALWQAPLILFGANMALFGQGLILSYVSMMVSLLVMVAVEPLFLSRLGTTPGKAILGLRVTDPSGQRLTYRGAAARTGMVIARGMGFEIPIYNLVRYFKSCAACGRGETLPWEEDSVLTLRTNKDPLRVLGLIAAYCGVVALVVVATLVGRLPDNRGDLTVAQFCENYNQMVRYYSSSTARLNPDGSWVEAPQTNDEGYTPENTIRLEDLFQSAPPQLTFTEEDGVMTGMQMTISEASSEPFLATGQEEMLLSIYAFVMAQDSYTVFSDDLSHLSASIAEHAFTSFDETLFGVRLTCQVDLEGYVASPETGVLFPETETEEGYVCLVFTMEKET